MFVTSGGVLEGNVKHTVDVGLCIRGWTPWNTVRNRERSERLDILGFTMTVNRVRLWSQDGVMTRLRSRDMESSYHAWDKELI